MSTVPQNLFGDDLNSLHAIQDLVRRLQLYPKLIRRQQEELIVEMVALDPSWIEEQKESFTEGTTLDEALRDRNWSEDDLDCHVALAKSLRLYSEQRFGPGLEEIFLSSNGAHDQVIYSVLRVRDPGLVQELWIRLEEGEATFAELASNFGEGPESSRKGLMGPVPMGGIVPSQLADLLRTLQPGEIHPPRQLGDWFLLIRLEQLVSARFDAKMKEFLLDQQLDSLLEERVRRILHGDPLESLEYDSSI